jgi:hypothetical protein
MSAEGATTDTSVYVGPFNTMCQPAVGIVNPVIGEEKLVVTFYPIPTRDEITMDISLESFSNVTVSFFEIDGSFIRKTSPETYAPGRHFVKFDISKVPPGVYYARVVANDKIETHKIVVLRE